MMRVSKLQAKNYRGLRDIDIDIRDVNLFIGSNASGKSSILDALRFLSEGVLYRDFGWPVSNRGGIHPLFWRHEEALDMTLAVMIEDGHRRFQWTVRLARSGLQFYVSERVEEEQQVGPPQLLLEAAKGEGWWWSPDEKRKVRLRQTPTACALAAASVDATFPARHIADYVIRWAFFDPSPVLLRQDTTYYGSGRLDSVGGNLGEALYILSQHSPATFDHIVRASSEILRIPLEVQPEEYRGRYYFLQSEQGGSVYLPQFQLSSGTLRVLALMTALYGEPYTLLIGIEEPENYIHPEALAALVEHLLDAGDRLQLLVTTHSPLLLDFIDDPEAVRVVNRHPERGTLVRDDINPEKVRRALDESGFRLGQYYETMGFGS